MRQIISLNFKIVRGLLVASLLSISLDLKAEVVLDSSCTISILNRTVQVSESGKKFAQYCVQLSDKFKPEINHVKLQRHL